MSYKYDPHIFIQTLKNKQRNKSVQFHNEIEKIENPEEQNEKTQIDDSPQRLFGMVYDYRNHNIQIK